MNERNRRYLEIIRRIRERDPDLSREDYDFFLKFSLDEKSKEELLKSPELSADLRPYSRRLHRVVRDRGRRARPRGSGRVRADSVVPSDARRSRITLIREFWKEENRTVSATVPHLVVVGFVDGDAKA
jgi:hypothetical protein